MLEEITPYEFFDQYEYNDDNIGALGLITPDNSFTVLTGEGDDWRKTNHGILRYQLLQDNYGLDLDVDIDNLENAVVATNEYEKKLKEYNSDGINSSIFIQYTTMEPFNFIRVYMPAYINSYQYEQLQELENELNSIKELLEEKHKDDIHKYFIGVEISNYNPLIHAVDDSIPSSLRINNEGDEDMSFDEINNIIMSGKDESVVTQNPLKVILEYMTVNNRVNDSIDCFEKQEVVSTGIRL